MSTRHPLYDRILEVIVAERKRMHLRTVSEYSYWQGRCDGLSAALDLLKESHHDTQG